MVNSTDRLLALFSDCTLLASPFSFEDNLIQTISACWSLALATRRAEESKDEGGG